MTLKISTAMQLIFQRLEIENFKCFTTKQVFDLTQYTPGLNFLQGRNDVEPALGSNGAGKSSVFDALTWCIYGRTVDNLRNPDIKPWYGKGTTRIGLKGVRSTYRFNLIRTANPNGL